MRHNFTPKLHSGSCINNVDFGRPKNENPKLIEGLCCEGMEEKDEQSLVDLIFTNAYKEWFPPLDDGCPALVIGQGVCGLTTALALAVHGNRVVHVIAEDEWDKTVSATSAAVWFPYMSDDPRTIVWARETLQLYDELLGSLEKRFGSQNISKPPKALPLNPACWVNSLSLSVRGIFDDSLFV